jgi:hypothetical protein
MNHAASQAPTSLIVLAMIPLAIFLRLRRARRAAQAQDFWFEPEGDHYIYHPFGRFGGAFLVAPATRDAIRAKMAGFARVAGMVVLVAAIGPMLLLSQDAPLYAQWRPWLLAGRIGMVLALIPAGLLWRVVAVKPLYAGAAPAPRRIALQDVRARRAAARSWWSLWLGFGVLAPLAVYLIYAGFAQRNWPMGMYGLVLAVVAVLNVRLLVTKFRV